MFFYHQISGSYSTNWRWPLEIGIDWKDREWADRLGSDWQIRNFYRINFIDEGLDPLSRFNIVFYRSLEEAQQQLYRRKWTTTNLIVVFSSTPITSLPAEKELLWDTVKYYGTGTNGLFVFHTTDDLRYWLLGFLLYLKRHKDLTKAMEATASSGYFIGDLDLNYPFLEERVFLMEERRPPAAESAPPPTPPPAKSPPPTPPAKSPPPPSFPQYEGSKEKFIPAAPRVGGLLSRILNFVARQFSRNVTRNIAQLDDKKINYFIDPEPGERGNYTTTKAPSKTKDSSRYLQAKIRPGADSDEFVRDLLLPGVTYWLDVRIGLPAKEYIVAPAEFPYSQVFEASEEIAETLQIVFITDNGQGLQTADLLLPRKGDSADIHFTFLTPVDKEVFTGEIYAYHKNRLIQKVVLTAHIKADDKNDQPPISMEVVFIARKELNTLSERAAFNTSIFYAPDNSAGSSLHVMSGNSLMDLHFTTALDELVNGIKNEIEDAVIDIDHHPEDLHHAENVRLLRRLAIKGSALYVNHLNSNDFKGPLQIVAEKAEFVPLDFVYTLPPPDRDADVCTGAVQALEAGSCLNCFHKGDWPAQHICPFGFWSFSRVIERHSIGKKKVGLGGEYHLLSEPVAGRDTLRVLQDTLFASSTKIDANTPGLRQKVATAIHQCTSQAFEANTWKEWDDLTQALSPDSLILLVHIERDTELDTDAMEIGDKQLLPREHLNKQKVWSQKTPKKSPMVIVIGCESADISNQGFDISSQFMKNGAAIVLSNFTKIRGRQAGPIVIKLVEFLKNNAGREMTLGEIVLKLKQYLLARGIIVGLSLVTHGDADWKIKT